MYYRQRENSSEKLVKLSLLTTLTCQSHILNVLRDDHNMLCAFSPAVLLFWCIFTIFDFKKTNGQAIDIILNAPKYAFPYGRHHL